MLITTTTTTTTSINIPKNKNGNNKITEIKKKDYCTHQIHLICQHFKKYLLIHGETHSQIKDAKLLLISNNTYTMRMHAFVYFMYIGIWYI